MDFNFSGRARSRPTINLGGGGGATASATSVAAAARRERHARDAQRRRDIAARTVQRVWRGRSTAARQRAAFAARLESVASAVRAGRSAHVSSDLVLAAALLVRIAAAPHAAGMQDHLAHYQGPLETYLSAARTSLPDRSVAILSPLSPAVPVSDQAVYVGILLRVSRVLLVTVAAPNKFDPAVSSGALDLLHALASASSTAAPTSADGTLVSLPQALIVPLVQQDAWFLALRRHIEAFPPVRKGAPSSISQAIDLALLPLTIFQHDSPDGRLVMRGFVKHILCTPQLASRIPVSCLTQLAMQMPYDPVVALLAGGDADSSFPPGEATEMVALTANFVALTNKRVPYLPNGRAVALYLTALSRLQAALVPSQAFAHVQVPTSSLQPPQDVDPPNHTDAAQAQEWNEATSKALLIIPSEAHLSAILAQSNRFSATSRPALFAFLTTTLNAGWPDSVREKVISHIMYSTNLVQGTGNRTATGGLIREIWRGWVRSSNLSSTLNSVPPGAGGATRNLLDTLTSPEYESHWAPIILLVELYSRALLTIGDDEFLSAGGGRNPLTVDEVSTLSGLLRNLAFALYWWDGVGPLGEKASWVIGTTVTLSRLRDVVTKLLQQLKARDVRHRFMPDGGWLMVPTMELQSFVQSVVTEEKALAAQDEDDEDTVPSTTNDAAMELDALAQTQRIRQARRTAANKRITAFLTPRLGVLDQIPFVVPFGVRVEIFRQFIQLDRDRLGIVDARAVWLARQRARVRRGHVAEDGYDQLNVPGGQLKGPIEITFVDKFGETEMGIDGGGLFKEFLTDVIKEAFDTNRGLWLANDQQEIYPNPHSYAQSTDALAWYVFLGRILGKAIYEGILVDVKFATFFLSKWVGSGRGLSNAYLDDLASVASLDAELYKGLVYLKNHPEQVDDMALNFTVTDSEFGVQKTVELVPNGSQIAVTTENRLQYIWRMSHYRLSTQIARQSHAFFSGLSEMIDPRWLRMLDPSELRVLISGTDQTVDVADLRAHTLYSGFDPHDDTIAYLWDTLESMSADDKRAFIKFVTSCPSAPLLGFSQLNPRFAVSRNGDDATRLPTASTCVNLLKLPRYTSRRQLEEKLLYAIHAHAGFDFS